jgi:hypothetical protein
MAGANGDGMGLPSEESTSGVRMKMKLQGVFEGNSPGWGKVWQRPFQMEQMKERWG